MNKLKTLKDLGLDDVNEYSCAEYILKAEAVKWVKNIDKDLLSESEADYLDRNKIKGLASTREWIKLFFNLTEKELK